MQVAKKPSEQHGYKHCRHRHQHPPRMLRARERHHQNGKGEKCPQDDCRHWLKFFPSILPGILGPDQTADRAPADEEASSSHRQLILAVPFLHSAAGDNLLNGSSKVVIRNDYSPRRAC